MLIGLFLFFLNAQTPDGDLMQQIANSGRCITVAETPDSRVEAPKLIAPGLAPLLSFRYFEDKKHHRFDNLDLMLDDAGH